MAAVGGVLGGVGAEGGFVAKGEEVVTTREMISSMMGAFLNGRGAVAAAGMYALSLCLSLCLSVCLSDSLSLSLSLTHTHTGCIMVLILTKVVKVAVPFLYQYVLDTLGSGGMSAPTW
jgi:hypothetical protein